MKWEKQRDWLLKEKSRLQQMLEKIEKNSWEEPLNVAVGELSGYDNHPADIASELFEREKDIALRDQMRLRLRAVEEALRMIERGNYGSCLHCGQRIPEERLEALPFSLLCHECKQKEEAWERSEPRPLEEKVLEDRRLRTELEFSGEDAGEELAVWGEHAPGTGAGSYYGGYEPETAEGAVEEVESILWYRGKDGMLYGKKQKQQAEDDWRQG